MRFSIQLPVGRCVRQAAQYKEKGRASPAFPASRAAVGCERVNARGYFLVSSFFAAAALPSAFLGSPFLASPLGLAGAFLGSPFFFSALAFFSVLALAFFSVLALSAFGLPGWAGVAGAAFGASPFGGAAGVGLAPA